MASYEKYGYTDSGDVDDAPEGLSTARSRDVVGASYDGAISSSHLLRAPK